jgi:serine/threonine-protein kinase
VPLPENSTVDYFALSPDGRRLALLLTRQGKSQVYLRPLDSVDLQPLAGIIGLAGGGAPLFWSPDSRFLGFFAEGKLKVVPAAGGPAQVLCEDLGGTVGEGTWNRNGVILIANSSGSLRRVNASGGPCTAVGNQVGPDYKIQSFFPMFLPDGSHFFYARRSQDQSSSGAYLAALDEPVGRRVLTDFSNVMYAAPANAGARAHLLFRRQNRLMAQRFDQASLQPVGDPFPVAADMAVMAGALNTMASVAEDGTLAYLAGGSGASQLTWYDRAGKELGKVGPRTEQYNAVLSPDGNSVAILRREENLTYYSLWLHDLRSGFGTRVTAPGLSINNGIVWSPDSRSVWFVGAGQQGAGIYQIDRESGPAQLIEKSDAPRSLSDRNSHFLVYTQRDPKTQLDIWYAPVESGKLGLSVKLVAGDAYESYGHLSPDGKWLAYADVDRLQIYIRPFPIGPGVWPLSAADPELSLNAFEPRWSADGKQLYFLTGNPSGRVTLMAVTVEPDAHSDLRFSSPQRLFEFRAPIIATRSDVFSYSPSSDGKRFLVNALVESGEPTVNIITNWQNAVPR